MACSSGCTVVQRSSARVAVVLRLRARLQHVLLLGVWLLSEVVIAIYADVQPTARASREREL